MFSCRVFLSILITLSILFKSTIGLALAQVTTSSGCPTLYGSVSYTAPLPPPVAPPLPVCGNMILEAPEICDDGNIFSGDGCSSTCILEGRPPDAFPAQVCGNMILEVPETCDDGNIVSGDGCSAVCNVEPVFPPPQTQFCGNHILEAPETCDDGNIFSGDGCSGTCTVEFNSSSSSGNPSGVCGNFIVEWPGPGPEQCDDGNTTNGDGCSSICQWEIPH